MLEDQVVDHILSAAEIEAVRRAYKLLYRSGLTLEESLDKLNDEGIKNAGAKKIADFIMGSKRSIVR